MMGTRKDRDPATSFRRRLPGAAVVLGALFLAGIFFACKPQKQEAQKPQVVAKKIVSDKVAKKTVPPENVKKKKGPEIKKPAPVAAGEKTASAPKTRALTPPVKPKNILSLLGLAPKEKGVPSGRLYNPKGKLDPFEPLFRQQPAAKSKKKKRKRRKGPLTPLEKVDLSQLRLTGVILAKTGNRALVREASGKGYVVKVGTPIGINSGRIVQILKDRIIVEEEVEDLLGKVTVKKRTMTLRKPPGE